MVRAPGRVNGTKHARRPWPAPPLSWPPGPKGLRLARSVIQLYRTTKQHERLDGTDPLALPDPPDPAETRVPAGEGVAAAAAAGRRGGEEHRLCAAQRRAGARGLRLAAARDR